MELDTKIAVSMAKMKVYSDVRSEQSACTNSSDANALRARNTGTSSLNPNVEPFLPSSSHSMPQQPPVFYTQARAAPENAFSNSVSSTTATDCKF